MKTMAKKIGTHKSATSGSLAPSLPEGAQVTFVPPGQLHQSFADLRGGRKPLKPTAELAPLPLRVVMRDDGDYEIIDGFKRFSQWRQEGFKQIPVVVEAPRSRAEAKVALLLANKPPRTVSTMDEARVVRDLRHIDQWGPQAIAKACGHRPQWVKQRLLLAEQLSRPVADKVDAGAIGVTLAHALCAVHGEEQIAICDAIDKHHLKFQEALALVSAFRVAQSDEQRTQLLAHPLETVRPNKRDVSPLGALGRHLEESLSRIRKALDDLNQFYLPDEGLTPPERRRLEAQYKAVIQQTMSTAAGLACEHLGLIPVEKTNGREPPSTERIADSFERGKAGDKGKEKDTQNPQKTKNQKSTNGISRRADTDRQATQDEAWHAGHCQESWIRPQNRTQCPERVWPGWHGGESVSDAEAAESRKQTGSVSGNDPNEGIKGPDGSAYSAGNSRRRLSGRADHLDELCPHPALRADDGKKGVATVRDSPSGGNAI
jgi:ParB-like chromosome segregation protein Spo0J